MKRFVSWDRDEPGREWASLTLLRDHAPGLAPLPLRHGLDAGTPYVVMSRLPGQALGDGPITANQLAAWATGLRRLHAIPADALRGSGLAERISGPAAARATVRSWLDDEADLSTSHDPGLVDAAVGAARQFLDTTPAPAWDDARTVFGRGDGNAANLLWDGERCYFVDFEDAGLSLPSYEVADFLEHLSVRPHLALAPDVVADLVGLDDTEREHVGHHRRVFACFWLTMLLPGNRAHDRNPAGTLEEQARHTLGLLDG